MIPFRLVLVIVEGKQIVAPEDFSNHDGVPASRVLPVNAHIEDASPAPGSSAHGNSPHSPVSPTSTSLISGLHAYSNRNVFS